MAGLSPSQTTSNQSRKQLISEHAFKVVVWNGVGLCAIACILRFCVRLVCFRRFLAEDYLMLAAMVTLIAIAVILQIFLSDVYELYWVQSGLKPPEPNFIDRMSAGLRGEGISMILDVVGMWLVKLNFLLLFYRIGHHLRTYLILWWVSLVVVVCCGVASLGLIPYECTLSSMHHITLNCVTNSKLKKFYNGYIATVVIDVFSDLIIIGFPIFIVSKAGLDWRQQLILSSIFLLVGFTIGATIVRGSVIASVYKPMIEANSQILDSSQMLFWLFVEYVVSFVIACLVSFRSLWSSRDRSSESRRTEALNRRVGIVPQQRNGDNGLRSKWGRVREDILTTFASLEGTTFDHNGAERIPSESHLDPESHLGATDIYVSNWGSEHGVQATDEVTKGA